MTKVRGRIIARAHIITKRSFLHWRQRPSISQPSAFPSAEARCSVSRLHFTTIVHCLRITPALYFGFNEIRASRLRYICCTHLPRCPDNLRHTQSAPNVYSSFIHYREQFQNVSFVSNSFSTPVRRRELFNNRQQQMNEKSSFNKIIRQLR